MRWPDLVWFYRMDFFGWFPFCLAMIVECSGFHASYVLAGNRIDLVWDTVISDVPEVCLSVLMSAGSHFNCDASWWY
jgi:hypothetical protein